MRATTLLVKEGIHNALQGKENKPSKLEDGEWNNIDFRAKTTIILCLLDKVLYNIMNENSAQLWCTLESLYMTNSLFMKKQLYSLQMKEGMLVL